MAFAFDIVQCCRYAVIGIAAIVVARGYTMGTSVRMGPGYFPTMLGALLALVGVVSMIRSFLHEGEGIAAFLEKRAPDFARLRGA